MINVKTNKKEGPIDKDHEHETKDEKIEGEDGVNKQNKFKKVEMPIFNMENTDSWPFRADRYFQIHKLTDVEKVLVATISFEGPTLN